MQASFRLDRSLPGGLRLFVICVCLAIAGMYGVTTFHARQIAVQTARREVDNLAASLVQQAADTVETAEGALAEVVERVEVEGTSPESRVLLNENMAQAVVAMPRLHALLIVDERGHLLLDNASSESRADLDFRASEFFRYHRANASRGSYVSGPVRSKTEPGTWVINVSRRIDHSNGRFAGVAVAQVMVDYFLQTYGAVDIGRLGVISLARDNGTILARRPHSQAFLGHSIAKSALFRSVQHGATSGSDMARSVLDKVLRLNAFRKSDRYPLLIIVGLAQDEFLANWRADALSNAAVAVAIVSLIAWLGMFLSKQIDQRRAAEDTLARLALIDGLTGIANRRHLDEAFEREWRSATRDGMPLTALMIDVDYFKDYNDGYGHARGDEVLQMVAGTITGNIRPTDFVARYGGEEFVVILPSTDAQQAVTIAERVRLAIVDRNIIHAGAPQGLLSVSIGVASHRPTRSDVRSVLIEAADAALYAAKGGGRNRCVSAGQSANSIVIPESA